MNTNHLNRKITRIILFLIPVVLITVSCARDNHLLSVKEGADLYTMTMYDQTRTAIATGEITLEALEGDQVQGEWIFNPSNARENINNIFTGEGTLLGQLKNDSLSVDLHPGWADNNIYLYGIVKNDSLNGTWDWVGFPGIIEQGTFRSRVHH